MAKVYWSETAQAELDAVALYIAERSERNALAFIDTVDEVVQLLAENPGMGRLREELAPEIRSWPVGNYLLFYRALTDGVEVARLIHGARHLEALFRDG